MLHIDQSRARIKVARHIIWAHLPHKSIGISVDGSFSGNGYVVRILCVNKHIGRFQGHRSSHPFHAVVSLSGVGMEVMLQILMGL